MVNLERIEELTNKLNTLLSQVEELKHMIQQRNEEPSSDDDSQDTSEVEDEEEPQVCCCCFTRKQKLK
jgi:hypothetical protein